MTNALSIKAASKEYGISERRLSSLIAKGLIEADGTTGRRCIPRRALEAYFQPAPPPTVNVTDLDALRLVVREEVRAALKEIFR